MLAGTGADVDDVVGGEHRLLVVLDDEHGVAEIAEPFERRDQLRVVALVEADRGLVEHVEHADERGADLGREPDPLRLAAGKRRGGALHREVADADVLEEAGAAPRSRARSAARCGARSRVSSTSPSQRSAPRTDSAQNSRHRDAADEHRARLGTQARAAAVGARRPSP
ncbi:MAG: hypothetical protein V9E83_14515 [Baekduia sp.]